MLYWLWKTPCTIPLKLKRFVQLIGKRQILKSYWIKKMKYKKNQ